MFALGAVSLIGAATLTGSSDSVPAPWCVPCALRNPGLAADLVVNFLLFIPLGVGLRLTGFRAAAVLSAAVALSLTVSSCRPTSFLAASRMPWTSRQTRWAPL